MSEIGYFTTGHRMTEEELAAVKGRSWEECVESCPVSIPDFTPAFPNFISDSHFPLPFESRPSRIIAIHDQVHLTSPSLSLVTSGKSELKNPTPPETY